MIENQIMPTNKSGNSSISMIDINVNDAWLNILPKTTLLQLLQQLNVNSQQVAIVVNEAVIPRSTWSEHVCNHHDRIDFFSAVAGG